MKIAYLVHWNEGPESGVFKKMVGQMTAWSKLGHETALFLFTRGRVDEWKEALPATHIVVQRYQGIVRRFTAFRTLAERVDQWKPDVVYHRYDLYYFSLPKLLKNHASVLEINTNDLSEMGMRRNFRYYYHRLTRGKILKAAKGFVFVSNELADEPHYRCYAKDWIVIGNSIDLNCFTPVEPSVDKRSAPRLIFISSPGQHWQGIDAIATMADLFPEWQFDFVGIESSELGLPVPPNMRFHGRLTEDKYRNLMECADIAISTLALYRKRMQEASSLKVREYLANGLPTIIGNKDTDFPAPVPFLLQLPNEPNSVRDNSDRIKAFVSAWRGRRLDRSDIRHLDVGVKEAARVNYMRGIIEKR